MEIIQKELFPLAAVKQPRNCRECAFHYEDPYDHCRRKPGVIVNVRHICRFFLFADEQSLSVSKKTNRLMLINNKV